MLLLIIAILLAALVFTLKNNNPPPTPRKPRTPSLHSIESDSSDASLYDSSLGSPTSSAPSLSASSASISPTSPFANASKKLALLRPAWGKKNSPPTSSSSPLPSPSSSFPWGSVNNDTSHGHGPDTQGAGGPRILPKRTVAASKAIKATKASKKAAAWYASAERKKAERLAAAQMERDAHLASCMQRSTEAGKSSFVPEYVDRKLPPALPSRPALPSHAHGYSHAHAHAHAGHPRQSPSLPPLPPRPALMRGQSAPPAPPVPPRPNYTYLSALPSPVLCSPLDSSASSGSFPVTISETFPLPSSPFPSAACAPSASPVRPPEHAYPSVPSVPSDVSHLSDLSDAHVFPHASPASPYAHPPTHMSPPVSPATAFQKILPPPPTLPPPTVLFPSLPRTPVRREDPFGTMRYHIDGHFHQAGIERPQGRKWLG